MKLAVYYKIHKVKNSSNICFKLITQIDAYVNLKGYVRAIPRKGQPKHQILKVGKSPEN